MLSLVRNVLPSSDSFFPERCDGALQVYAQNALPKNGGEVRVVLYLNLGFGQEDTCFKMGSSVFRRGLTFRAQ